MAVPDLFNETIAKLNSTLNNLTYPKQVFRPSGALIALAPGCQADAMPDE